MPSVQTVDLHSLSVEWMDERRLAEYRRDPWDPSWGMGRLFSAVVPLEGPQTIGLGVRVGGDEKIDWVWSDHGIDDAQALVEALFRKRGWDRAGETHSPRARPEPESSRGVWKAFLDRIRFRRAVSPRAVAGEAVAKPSRWTVVVSLDERESERMRDRIRRSGARASTHLFHLAQGALAAFFGLSGPTSWMFSTQARHMEEPEKDRSGMKSSYFLFKSDTAASLRENEENLTRHLRSRAADRNWKLGAWLSGLPPWLLVALTWIDFYGISRRSFGLYTYLGKVGPAVPEPRIFFWRACVRRTRPVSVVAQDWFGRIQVSVNLHEVLNLDEKRARELGARMADLFARETRGSE